MNPCKICGGDKNIAGDVCQCCEGTGLPIEISDDGQQHLAWREPRNNEFNLLVYSLRTMQSIAGCRSMMIENGKTIYSPLTQERRQSMIDRALEGELRETEMNVCANSLEEAKREAFEVFQGFGDVVIKVEERGYSGWGIKSIDNR